MSVSTSTDDGNYLLSRMESVRASGYDHAGELHCEAKRLVDWKEYVRSKPLMSVAVASVIGFSLVRSTLGISSQTNQLPSRNMNVQESPTSSQSTWRSGAIALVSNVATTAIKHYLASLLQRRSTVGGFNDRFRNTGSQEQNIGSVG